MLTRRQFLKAGALAGAGLLVPWQRKVGGALASVQVPQVPLPGGAIGKWVDPLPIPYRINATGGGPLAIAMSEFQQKVLPAAFYTALAPPCDAGTYVWGYEGAYPGPTIVAQRGVPLDVTWVNNLMNPVLQQYLTVDQTLHWADPLGTSHINNCMMHMPGMPPNPPCDQPYAGPVPTVVHVHGAEVQSFFDGHPDAWWTPSSGPTGPAYSGNTYTYVNTQEAATLWYHDHSLGVTRLNVYAGLAGFYLLRDPANEPANLPGGPYEIEIVIQDRMFDTNGQWFFPDSPPLNPEHPFWLPEFLGDAIVVNGKTWPYLSVEPRRYRFRFLNGSNARFYSMRLMDPVTMLPGPPIWQIGTDGGLLDTPVMINFPNELLIAPGERADVIIDFAAIMPGTGPEFILYNSARAPFPKGAPVNPNTTGQIMKFVVGPGPVTDQSYDPASGLPLRTGTYTIKRLASGGALNVTPDVSRQLTLNEVMGPGGPLEVLLNNTKWDGTMSGLPAPGITEMPQVSSTEVWEIINLTADAHPIHLHLVQFQLLSRQRFQINKYLKAYAAAFDGAFVPAAGPPGDYNTPNADGAVGGNPAVGPYLQGKVISPAPNEAGWKDTVIMYPGEVTRIVARFAPQDIAVGGTNPGTNDFAFDPSAGPGYVWHCHILDHEDNEMMRPYKVV